MPNVEHHFIPFQPHARVDTVAGGKDVSTAGHAVTKGVADRLGALVVRPVVQEAAIDVTIRQTCLPYFFFTVVISTPA